MVCRRGSFRSFYSVANDDKIDTNAKMMIDRKKWKVKV